jgi:hypothetical protein
LTKSLNRGIEMSRGKYIARQDVDDISVLTRLQNQYQVIEETGVDLVTAQTLIKIDDVGRIAPTTSQIRNFSLAKLKFGNILIHGTFFVNAEILKENRYDEIYQYAQDYELILRLLNQKRRLKIIPEILYHSAKPSESISVNRAREQGYFGKKACVKHFGTDRFHMSSKPLYYRFLLRAIRLFAG